MVLLRFNKCLFVIEHLRVKGRVYIKIRKRIQVVIRMLMICLVLSSSKWYLISELSVVQGKENSQSRYFIRKKIGCFRLLGQFVNIEYFYHENNCMLMNTIL